MAMPNRLLGFLGIGTVLASVTAGALATGTSTSDVRADLGSCAAYAGLPAGDGETAGMVFIPAGRFQMGSERHQPEERFTHLVRVDGFWIDRHEVTNAQFKQFVDATGYRTLAERGSDPAANPNIPKELLVPGSAVFTPPSPAGRSREEMEGWQYLAGANWQRPTGPGSSLAGLMNQPVVHIAYEDALAYAQWRGHSLPTEAQWEFAARGGRDGEDDWSSAFGADGKPIANTWQGLFPVLNTKDDGYVGAAPVGCFKPNGYGLYDMIGNVWEWTSDWYQPGHSRAEAINPTGPVPASAKVATAEAPSRVIKGGSHLCASNYCARYRPAARQPQEVNFSASHVGFRTVLNKPAEKSQ